MIDLHVNGSGEADVGEANLTAMETISRSLAAHGTTGFLGHSEADRALLHPGGTIAQGPTSMRRLPFTTRTLVS